MPKLPQARVVPVSEMTIDTLAQSLQVGDVWVGESPIRIDAIEPGDTIDVIPWNAGRNAPPVEVVLVRITGQIIGGRDKGFKGTWSLQPDQPMEVRRSGQRQARRTGGAPMTDPGRPD